MNQRYPSSAVWILLLIPIISFGIYIFSFALNAPYNDDVALISTLNKIHNPEINLFHTILEQQNDHRIVFSRLATILIFWVSGEMNFRTMILLGYLNLMVLGYAFYLIFKSEKMPFVYFLPVSILLFSPIVQGTHLWAITSFEYTLAIAFSLFSLYFLQQARKKIWILSLLFAVAASLSNLDGLCVFLVGLAWLIIQKRTKESLIYSGFMILYLWLFFYNFHFSASTAPPSGAGFAGNVLKGFISFTGGIVKVLSDSRAYSLSFVAGGIFISIFLIIMTRKILAQTRKSDQLLPISLTDICFLELLACAFMVAIGRANDTAESMVAIRFQIYAVTILILLYLVIISNISSSKLKSFVGITFMMGAIALNLLSYIKYTDSVHNRNSELTADAYNYNSHAFFLHQIPEMKTDSGFYRYYKFPAYLQEEIVQWKHQFKQHTLTPNITLKCLEIPGSSGSVKAVNQTQNFEVGNIPKHVPCQNVYLALFESGSNRKPILIALRPETRGWLDRIFNKSTPLLLATIHNAIPDSSCDVAVCWVDDGEPGSILIAKNFKFKSPALDKNVIPFAAAITQ
jgi:hypothetical protein